MAQIVDLLLQTPHALIRDSIIGAWTYIITGEQIEFKLLEVLDSVISKKHEIVMLPVKAEEPSIFITLHLVEKSSRTCLYWIKLIPILCGTPMEVQICLN